MDYEKQAQNFLEKTGTEIKIEYIKTGKYFEDDKYPRDIYGVILSKGGREFRFTFGNSLIKSGRYWKEGDYRRGILTSEKPRVSSLDWVKNKNFAAPNPYDILATMTKYDPGTFAEFCRDFGYDDNPLSDYHKIKRIYEAAKDEYNNLEKLYNDSEMELLREIE